MVHLQHTLWWGNCDWNYTLISVLNVCTPYTLMNSSLGMYEEGAELPSVTDGGPMTCPHLERWADFSSATQQIEMQVFFPDQKLLKLHFPHLRFILRLNCHMTALVQAPLRRVLFLRLARNQDDHTYLGLGNIALPPGMLGEEWKTVKMWGIPFLVRKVESKWKQRK